MLRIRFHGRGGQGIKTASRILGTAAFYEGYMVQDFPMYGPERRGAPVTAFVRISDARETLVERGYIRDPDVVIIADDTLIDDPTVNPLSGLSDGIIFVNSVSRPPVEGNVIHYDVTGEAIRVLGRGGAISSGIGAVASKILGFKLANLVEAVSTELDHIGLSQELIEKNILIAKSCYSAIDYPASMPSVSREGAKAEGDELRAVKLALDPNTLSIATICSLGNTELKNTGSWRVMKPVIDIKKCIKCDLCFIYCPEGCIKVDDQGLPSIVYTYCKGCLICSAVCPVRAINTIREVRTW